MGEVALDRAGSNKQGLGDLAVCEPFGGQFGDAALASCERFESSEQPPTRPGPGGAQLGLRP